MEITNTNAENKNSIVLKKDSKGNYNYDIKVYYIGGEYKEAIKELQTIENYLKNKYLKEVEK